MKGTETFEAELNPNLYLASTRSNEIIEALPDEIKPRSRTSFLNLGPLCLNTSIPSQSIFEETKRPFNINDPTLIDDVVVHLPVFSLFGSFFGGKRKRAKNGWAFVEKNVMSPNKTLHPNLRYQSILARKKMEQKLFEKLNTENNKLAMDSVRTGTPRTVKKDKYKQLTASLYEKGSSFSDSIDEIYYGRSPRSEKGSILVTQNSENFEEDEIFDYHSELTTCKGRILKNRNHFNKDPSFPEFLISESKPKEIKQEIEKNPHARRSSCDLTLPYYDLCMSTLMGEALKRRGKSIFGTVFGKRISKKTRHWLQVTHPRFVPKSIQVLESSNNLEGTLVPKNITSVRKVGFKKKTGSVMKFKPKSIAKGDGHRFSKIDGNIEKFISFKRATARHISINSNKKSISEFPDKSENPSRFWIKNSEDLSGFQSDAVISETNLSTDDKIAMIFPRFGRKELFGNHGTRNRNSVFGSPHPRQSDIPARIGRHKLPKLTFDPRSMRSVAEKSLEMTLVDLNKSSLKPVASHIHSRKGSRQDNSLLTLEIKRQLSKNKKTNKSLLGSDHLSQEKSPLDRTKSKETYKYLFSSINTYENLDENQDHLQTCQKNTKKLLIKGINSNKNESIATLFKMHQSMEQDQGNIQDNSSVNFGGSKRRIGYDLISPFGSMRKASKKSKKIAKKKSPDPLTNQKSSN